MVCVGLQQFAEFAAFFSVPASSRKFRLLATNQKAGGSNPSGRATPCMLCSDLVEAGFATHDLLFLKNGRDHRGHPTRHGCAAVIGFSLGLRNSATVCLNVA